MTEAQSTPTARSHAEIQALLTREIEALQGALTERLAEIQTLSARIEAAAAAEAAEAGAAAAAAQEARIAQIERRHRLEITLLHALYASWHRGPATGVSAFDRQVAILEGSDLFDEEWYRSTYPDISASGFSPREHYVRSGAFEGRNPGPGFDTMAYYLANPDVAQAGWPALVHYAGFGKAEGRKAG